MEYLYHNVGADNFVHPSADNVFSKDNIALLRNKISLALKGVHPEDKKIVCTDRVIKGVLTSLYNNDFGNLRDINDNAIGIIVSYIKTEFDMIKQNNKLTPWVQQYGSNGYENASGLAAHSTITVREKRPFNPEFNMRY